MVGITPDQVEQALREEEANVARARARQMAWIEVARSMQLPTADGTASMREWLSGRLDISPDTARRLSATAKRLADRHDIARDLVDGEVSFDRAEAESKIPAHKAEAWHRGIDIRGLHRLAARHRREEPVDQLAAHASQNLWLQPNLDESMWLVWGRLDGYSGPVVDKVLTERADLLPDLPDGTRPGVGYRRAVALAELCESSGSTGMRTPVITVFVDEKGAETEGGNGIGTRVIDKVACTAAIEMIKTTGGRPLAMGHRSRIIPPALRRFILHRDGGCTADGCISRYRLEVHHKIPWSQGGPTDPGNLLTLCWFHHHVVVHGFGFEIDDTLGPGRIRFRSPSRSHDPP